METFSQKFVGFLVIALAIVLFFTVYSFTINTLNLNQELHKNCPLPEGVCPYTRSIPSESLLGFLVDGSLFVLGIYLIFVQKTMEKVSFIQKTKLKNIIRSLEGEEKSVYQAIVDSEGFVFQNELIQKTNLNKVKVSRILDKLEGKGLVERRRRGMSNVVVLKS